MTPKTLDTTITPIRLHSKKEVHRQKTNEEIKKKFLKIDTDNSGFIDLGELRKELNRQGYKINKRTTRKIIKTYDDNPDNKLEFGEYFQLQNDMDNRKMRKNIYRQVLSTNKQHRQNQKRRTNKKTKRRLRKH